MSFIFSRMSVSRNGHVSIMSNLGLKGHNSATCTGIGHILIRAQAMAMH